MECNDDLVGSYATTKPARLHLFFDISDIDQLSTIVIDNCSGRKPKTFMVSGSGEYVKGDHICVKSLSDKEAKQRKFNLYVRIDATSYFKMGPPRIMAHSDSGEKILGYVYK